MTYEIAIKGDTSDDGLDGVMTSMSQHGIIQDEIGIAIGHDGTAYVFLDDDSQLGMGDAWIRDPLSTNEMWLVAQQNPQHTFRVIRRGYRISDITCTYYHDDKIEECPVTVRVEEPSTIDWRQARSI